ARRLDDAPVALLAGADCLFRQLALGDVVARAGHAYRLPTPPLGHRTPPVEPARRGAVSDHPEVELEGLPGGQAGGDGLVGDVAVALVDEGHEAGEGRAEG